ncbi:TPA: hypothetical protein ACUNF5_004492 [Burkholderia orbicola]|nr:hypothetical protein DF039_34925 [Burkholderia cenocepacia]
MKLDRTLQRHILDVLANAYPGPLEPQIYKPIYESQSEDILFANLLYLEEHGLIRSGLRKTMSGHTWSAQLASITAAGLDFLQEDGGLSAILGTVTVKIHADTIRDIFESRISASDLPAEEKNRLLDHLKTLPAEALKHLTTQTVTMAMDRLPNALHWLGTQIGL